MEEGIRIGAAAQALGVSVDTLRRWERDGRIAFERP
jgi:excisionase family DNA binding protein